MFASFNDFSGFDSVKGKRYNETVGISVLFVKYHRMSQEPSLTLSTFVRIFLATH